MNQALLTLVGTILLASVGFFALMLVRAGWDYASSRGNPRGTAQAHESLLAVGKGALLAGGAVAIATYLVKTFSIAGL